MNRKAHRAFIGKSGDVSLGVVTLNDEPRLELVLGQREPFRPQAFVASLSVADALELQALLRPAVTAVNKVARPVKR